MKKNDITRKLVAAILCIAALGASGCSAASKDDNGKNSGSDKKAEIPTSDPDEADDSAESDMQKVEVFLDEDGTPYYIDSEGTKMMLFSMPFAEDDDYDYGDDEYLDDYDYTQNFVRGEYDADGLKFTIPDGWFAENTFGAPMIFQDYAEGEEINYDETISIVPTAFVFEPGEDGNITDEILEDYFAELIDNGLYSDYSITDSGDIIAAGIEARYYDIFAAIETDDTSESFRTRYIITSGDNSHCFILTALDDDESFKMVIDTFDSFSDTIVLPTAEQMKQALT